MEPECSSCVSLAGGPSFCEKRFPKGTKKPGLGQNMSKHVKAIANVV